MQFLDKVSPCPLLCYVCLGPDSVFTQFGVSAVAVHHGRRCCFHAVFPFIFSRPVLPSVYTAWTIVGGAVLGQVVLARRCTTPGAVYVIVLFHLLQETHDEASPALLAMDVLGFFVLVCFFVLSCLCY